MAFDTVPHAAFPLRIDPATGSFATVEQDSSDEISQCVTVILATHPGTRWDLPDLGLPDPVFHRGFDIGVALGQIGKYEPRAQVDMTASDPAALAVDVLAKIAELRRTGQTATL